MDRNGYTVCCQHRTVFTLISLATNYRDCITRGGDKSHKFIPQSVGEHLPIHTIKYTRIFSEYKSGHEIEQIRTRRQAMETSREQKTRQYDMVNNNSGQNSARHIHARDEKLNIFTVARGKASRIFQKSRPSAQHDTKQQRRYSTAGEHICSERALHTKQRVDALARYCTLS
ncbi:hypothetical protein CBL_07145 [Carabus blaptoides fortunei]